MADLTAAAAPHSDLYLRLDGYEALKPLLEGSDEDVLVRLARPTLIRIPALTRREQPPARLVACLLHGNEDSGFRAVLDVLRSGARYPFDLWVLIGNVRAATHDGWFAHRYLDDQEDFNRVWGVAPPTTRMRRCAAAILAELEDVELEAAVDLHNNTGVNPFYAVVPRSTLDTLALAATCTDIALLWPLNAHTLMEALVPRCPSIAIECGLAGIPANAAFAADALARFLAADDFATSGRRPERVFEIRARAVVRPEVPFAFGGVLTDELDLVLVPGLDHYNFGMVLAGTELGHVHPGAAMPITIADMRGADVTDRYVRLLGDGRLVAGEDFTPVMITTTVLQARRDCLFYVARRVA